MLSVKIQLKRHIHRLVKMLTNDFRIDHNFNSGVIYYKSDLIMNYFDCRVFYTFDNSTNNFDDYKLNIQLDYDKQFADIYNTIVTIKR